MGAFSEDIRYRLLKRRAIQRYPRYKFQKDRTGYLTYCRDLKPWFRRLLNHLRDLLGWMIEKRNANDLINRRILDSMGLSPETDITSLDAFYKREFRKKKYIYFFVGESAKNLPEPSNFLFEYMPKAPDQNKRNFFKGSFDKLYKKK